MATIDHEIRIKATRDGVFEALATSEGLRGWYTPQVDGEVAEGDEVVFRFDNGDSFRWKVAELSTGRSIRWECVEGPGAAPGTSVVYRLSDASDGRTQVECSHEGWPTSHDALATCNTLWGILMGRLKDYAESGRSDPAPH